MEIILFVIISAGLAFFNWRVLRTYEKDSGALHGKLDSIHVLVNSKMTVALERIDELEKALREERDDSV